LEVATPELAIVDHRESDAFLRRDDLADRLVFGGPEVVQRRCSLVDASLCVEQFPWSRKAADMINS
jgi:hypothetical protein